MAQKSTRRGLKNKYVDYLGNLIIDGKIKQDILTSTKTRNNYLRPILETTTVSGVTCTNNGDGTYTLNGTALSRVIFQLSQYTEAFNNKELRLVGCPRGGSRSSFSLYFRAKVSSDYFDYGNGVNFNVTRDEHSVAILIEQGSVIDNLVFKPMLTDDLSATYDDFVSGFDSLTPDIKMDLLWKNTTLSSSFVAQAINLNLSRYKYLMIFSSLYNNTDDNKNMMTCTILYPNRKATILITNSLSYVYERVVSWRSNSELYFDKCFSSDSSASTRDIDNNGNIPNMIYGVL